MYESVYLNTNRLSKEAIDSWETSFHDSGRNSVRNTLPDPSIAETSDKFVAILNIVKQQDDRIKQQDDRIKKLEEIVYMSKIITPDDLLFYNKTKRNDLDDDAAYEDDSDVDTSCDEDDMDDTVAVHVVASPAIVMESKAILNDKAVSTNVSVLRTSRSHANVATVVNYNKNR